MSCVGRTILITGASGGLGREIVKKFDESNNNLVLFDSSKDVLKIKEELNIKCNILPVVGNVANESDVKNLINIVKEKFNSIDVLISNAGVFIAGKVEEVSSDMWQKSFEVNVTGTYLLCKYILPIMREKKKGHIVTVASHYGLVGGYQSAAYCASKGALIQLTKAIALDYAQDKIFANCVCPGFMDTGMLKNLLKEVGMNRNWMDVMRGLPVNKISIEEVADNIYNLSQTKSITGSSIVIDGGYIAR